jgi:CubicO group peptidase (beta-lactamase class C family)
MLSRVRRCVRTPDSFWIYYESLTATLVLQHVERGTIDLAERVVKYLPEFRLTTSGAAEKIRVRHLLDAHERDRRRLVFPRGSRRPQYLPRRDRPALRDLFEPGEYNSYSNGGMDRGGSPARSSDRHVVPDLLRRELYATVGMADSSTSAEEAIVRSTAVGHFPGADASGVRRTYSSNFRTRGRRREARRSAPSATFLRLEGVAPRPGSPERAPSCCPSRSGRWMMS